MVENSPLWAGYETVCSADIGYNNASIFIQTNKNGVFENLTQSITLTYPKSEYKPSECSNVHAIAFQRTYTADWNETVFRCVVEDADNTLMDAEIIYVVPGWLFYKPKMQLFVNLHNQNWNNLIIFFVRT